MLAGYDDNGIFIAENYKSSREQYEACKELPEVESEIKKLEQLIEKIQKSRKGKKYNILLPRYFDSAVVLA